MCSQAPSLDHSLCGVGFYNNPPQFHQFTGDWCHSTLPPRCVCAWYEAIDSLKKKTTLDVMILKHNPTCFSAGFSFWIKKYIFRLSAAGIVKRLVGDTVYCITLSLSSSTMYYSGSTITWQPRCCFESVFQQGESERGKVTHTAVPQQPPWKGPGARYLTPRC